MSKWVLIIDGDVVVGPFDNLDLAQKYFDMMVKERGPFPVEVATIVAPEDF